MMNTRTNNPIENELNAIRIAIYEQTKDMTSSEFTAFIKRDVDEGLKRHGIKLAFVESAN